jgi:hypothetical protein
MAVTELFAHALPSSVRPLQDIEAQLAALEEQLRREQAGAELAPAEGEALEESAHTMAAD